MADEWSKPEEEGGVWVSRLWEPMGLVSVGEKSVEISDEYESSMAPRDVVLRLLAAEASDRLGWVWEVEPKAHRASGSCLGEYVVWTFDTTDTDLVGFTTDQLLAAMHGSFLLQDALREAGQ